MSNRKIDTNPPAGRAAQPLLGDERVVIDILEAVPEATVIVDRKGKIVFARLQIGRMSGCPRPPPIGNEPQPAGEK